LILVLKDLRHRVGWSYFVTTLLGEDQLGPVPNEEFVELVKSKVIKPSSRIHHPSFTQNRWVEAKKVKAFLDLRQQMANLQAAEKLKRKKIQTPPIVPPEEPEAKSRFKSDQATEPETASTREPKTPPEMMAEPAVAVATPKPSMTLFQPRQYRAIGIVIVIFYVVAGLLVLASLYTVGSVIIVGLSGSREVAQSALAALLLSTPIIFSMLFGALINFTIGQVLQLLIHVQENTQRTAHYTENRK
jgi:hypothetical protein